MGDADLNEVAPTYKSLLKDTGIQFRQADVKGIDKDAQTVYVDCSDIITVTVTSSSDGDMKEKKIHYDSLIVATGSEVNLEKIPGASELALPFYSIENVLELRKRLTLLDSLQLNNDIESQKPLEVVVVGGGYSGVEIALNMVERLKHLNVKVTLVHRGKEVLEVATEHNRKTGLDRLIKSGVEIMTESSVVEVLPSDTDTDITGHVHGLEELSGRARVVLEIKSSSTSTSAPTEQTLNADILLWTAGAMRQNIPVGILNSELPRDASGRLVTDKYLAVKGCNNVFALGDCARTKKVPYAATAAVAMQQAPFAAWNVYSSIMMSSSSSRATNVSKVDDETLKPIPFSYLDLGEMLTLGGEDATISSLGLVEVSGPAASVLRRLIYAVRMPTVQQALTAAISGSSKRFESLLVSASSAKSAKQSKQSKQSKGASKEKGKKIINWQ